MQRQLINKLVTIALPNHKQMQLTIIKLRNNNQIQIYHFNQLDYKSNNYKIKLIKDNKLLRSKLTDAQINYANSETSNICNQNIKQILTLL